MTSIQTTRQTVARSTEKTSLEIEDLDLVELENQDLQESKTFKPVNHKKRNILIVILVVLLLSVISSYIDAFTTRNMIARGVSISNINVGNMNTEKALEKLEPVSSTALETPMRFDLEDQSLSISSQDLDLVYDIQDSVDAALKLNNSLNPINVLPSFFQRTTVGKNITVSHSYDEEKYQEILELIVSELSTGRVDAAIEIDGTQVNIIEPQTGQGVSKTQVKSYLDNFIRSFEREPATLKLEDVQAQITLEEAQRVAKILETMFSQDSTIRTANGNRITVPKELLASVIEIKPNGSTLDLSINESKLRENLDVDLTTIELEPQDASFSVNGNSVSIVPEVQGKKLDFNSALERWIAGEHNFIIDVVDVKPVRDTQWAQNLNITEQVSTFTSNFPAGQPRVKNISRAAEVVDSTILEPGETFSLNDTLGPRTEASGYVKAPAFSTAQGFYDDFGGGVSQFSTALFNAYYFGGYKNITHKPHTIYISRYPMGREATLNYGSVDLKFQNNSESGVLIKTYMTSTSVTVTLYGNKEGKKVTSQGPNIIAETPIETKYTDDPSLDIGVEREIQSGYRGITVENIRIIERSGQEPKQERFRWTYKMLPREVLRGTKAPQTSQPTEPTETTVTTTTG